MGITFRHDAAAVVPPSNNATRKYGQSLVLQQQQQKYAAQQAGYDRMFDAYKMENQQQFQDRRDTKQVVNQQLRDWQQQDFQKQQMEAARQQQFMDDARKLSSGMIMEDIRNGHYDPATASKLRKNLVDEADALADKTLDATQRKKVLDGLRADRLLHTSNRMEKPPAPTPQEQFDQGVVNRNGVDYIQDSKGKWTPLEPSKAQQEQEKMIQQQELEAQKMRPMSAQEYYSQNEDKFQKDLDSTMKSMQSEYDAGTRKEAPTPEAAWEQMQKNHDFKQKALGKAQYGEPTPAKPYGQALEEARQASKNNVKGGDESFAALSDMNDKLLELENRANSFPKGSKEASAAWSQYRKERDRIINERWITPRSNGDIQPAPEMRSILEQPGQQKIPATPMPGQPVPTAPSAPSPAQPAPSPPVAVTPPSPAQNAWEQVATPPATPTPQATPQSPAPNDVDMGAVDSNGRIVPNNKTTTTKQKPPQSAKQPAAPDFGALASRSNGANKQAILAIQNIYQSQTPDVQAAISVLLDDNSQHTDAAKALAYLQSKGIDMKSLTAKSKPDTQYRALGAGGR